MLACRSILRKKKKKKKTRERERDPVTKEYSVNVFCMPPLRNWF